MAYHVLALGSALSIMSRVGVCKAADRRCVELPQANMDARHRDKVAFIRVCSGRFEKGMKVRVARTGAP